jgi:iron complex outermembrane receptor protein
VFQSKSLKVGLFLSAATVATAGFSAYAQAQSAAGNVETVVVTGSRIAQQGVISASPVTVVGQQEAQFQGTTSVESLLNNLPAVFSGQQNFTGNASSGTATVNLRGLGASRTLVLVDGLRLAPGDPVVPYADLNQIPTALVDRVEVLTGGASAVYGSDAVAGVVNFIMRKDFEGAEFDVTYGGYQHDNGNSFYSGLRTAAGGPAAGFKDPPSSVWDGQQLNATLVLGVNTPDSKGNITTYLSYHQAAQVLQSKRDYSACSISNVRTKPTQANGQRPYDGFKCAGSANYDLFYGTTGPSAGTYLFMNPGGALVPFTGASNQYFNYGAYNSIQRPDTRWAGGFFAHYQINPMVDLYSSLMFTEDHTTWQAAPSGLFLGSGPLSGAHTVNCNNPLAAGTSFVANFCNTPTSTATVYVGRRDVEGGARITDFTHTTYRFVFGAKGDLGEGFTYDVSAQHSKSLYNQTYSNDFSKSKVQNALNVDPVTGKCTNDAANCVPLDLFHGVGGFTPKMLGYIFTHGQQAGYTEENVITGAVTGDLGAYGFKSPWSAQPVSFSLGAEYRSEYLALTTSTADQNNDLYGAGGANVGQPKSGFDVREGFGEVRIPIAENLPLIESLNFDAAYRFSSYSTAGDTNTWMVKTDWQPIDLFRLRASYNHAARAPNVVELYTPQSVLLGSFNDPCGGTTPSASQAACLNTGLPAARYGNTLNCPASQCNVLQGGSTALKPEKADTYTAGIVITPTEWISNFSMTIDYFNIKVNNQIGTIDPSIALNGCLNGNQALCPLVHRDANGLLFTQPNGYVSNLNVNTGYQKTSGVDFESNYNFSFDDLGLNNAGGMSFNYVATWLTDYSTQPYTGACQALTGATLSTCKAGTPAPAGATVYTSYDCNGLYGQACLAPTPEYRHKLRATWDSPWDFSLSLDWRYLSGVGFAGNVTNPFLQKSGYAPNAGFAPLQPVIAGGHIPDFSYFDLAGNWSPTPTLTFTAGINNLFDKDPPLVASGGVVGGPTGQLNGNTFPGVYDPLGRYAFVSAAIKL